MVTGVASVNALLDYQHQDARTRDIVCFASGSNKEKSENQRRKLNIRLYLIHRRDFM